MKKVLSFAIVLMVATSAVAGIANHQMAKDDKSFVERGGKIKGCESLRYEDGIVCIKPKAK